MPQRVLCYLILTSPSARRSTGTPGVGWSVECLLRQRRGLVAPGYGRFLPIWEVTGLAYLSLKLSTAAMPRGKGAGQHHGVVMLAHANRG